MYTSEDPLTINLSSGIYSHENQEEVKISYNVVLNGDSKFNTTIRGGFVLSFIDTNNNNANKNENESENENESINNNHVGMMNRNIKILFQNLTIHGFTQIDNGTGIWVDGSTALFQPSDSRDSGDSSDSTAGLMFVMSNVILRQCGIAIQGDTSE